VSRTGSRLGVRISSACGFPTRDIPTGQGQFALRSGLGIPQNIIKNGKSFGLVDFDDKTVFPQNRKIIRKSTKFLKLQGIKTFMLLAWLEGVVSSSNWRVFAHRRSAQKHIKIKALNL